MSRSREQCFAAFQRVPSFAVALSQHACNQSDRGAHMPRYFFHLKADTGTVVDDEGLFLNDIDRARSGILQIVDEILSERGFEQVDICGQSLEIADETGETVLSIEL